MKFKIEMTVREESEFTVEVEADNETEAYEIAQNKLEGTNEYDLDVEANRSLLDISMIAEDGDDFVYVEK